ncbi:DUF1534 domain-containing protein [Pseudomonas sp. ST1]|nr:hypothetical protein CCZ00_25625 [Pseudomonas savastanoi pv. fraxini]TSC35915.1 DUF1534 domain-containing protein [Pseudomonas sp. ST1]
MPTPCGHDQCSSGHLSFLTLQRGNAVHDAPRRKRTQSVQKGMRRRASHDSCDNRSSRSSVGMPSVTLCVIQALTALLHIDRDLLRLDRRVQRHVAFVAHQ